jgi:hypothetical protein
MTAAQIGYKDNLVADGQFPAAGVDFLHNAANLMPQNPRIGLQGILSPVRMKIRTADTYRGNPDQGFTFFGLRFFNIPELQISNLFQNQGFNDFSPRRI